MIADLHPTWTRLRLLRDVDAGLIRRAGNGHDYDVREYKVTAQVREACRAGWIVLGERRDAAARALYELTAEGRRVLDEAAHR
jgi:hypothetical protein